jgi:hypothetical protein
MDPVRERRCSIMKRESVSRRTGRSLRSLGKAISTLLLVMLVIQPVLARADDWGRQRSASFLER